MPADMSLRSVPYEDCCGYSDKDQQGSVCAHPSGVLQPLADVEADDVHTYSNRQQQERAGKKEAAIIGEVTVPGSSDVGAHGSARYQQSGKIEERIDPIRPAGDEPVKVAEGFAGLGEAG